MKPFIKWVGGKTQVLTQIDYYLPDNMMSKYVEPFLGGGSMFFHLSNKFNFDNIILNDLNKQLINCYQIIKENHIYLIDSLTKIEKEFNDSDDKLKFYLHIREKYNNEDITLNSAVYFIFLNKTCFNGLYRVNKKGLFNVPFGKYEKIKLFEKENIINISKKLQNVTLLSMDYNNIIEYIDNDTFVYLDPPYRPISKTSSFSNYQNNGFNENNQIQLSDFCKNINLKSGKFMLSNSFVNDDFYEKYYLDFATINEIKAKRSINSKGTNRGEISEVLILNY